MEFQIVQPCKVGHSNKPFPLSLCVRFYDVELCDPAHDEMIAPKPQQLAECLFYDGGCFASPLEPELFSSLRCVSVIVLVTVFEFMIVFFSVNN